MVTNNKKIADIIKELELLGYNRVGLKSSFYMM